MFIFCHLGEIYDRWSTQIPNNNNRDHLVGRLTNWNHSPQPIYQIQPDKPKTICKAALRSFFPQEAGQPPHNTILFLTPILFWQNIHQKSWGENCWQFWLRCLAAATESVRLLVSGGGDQSSRQLDPTAGGHSPLRQQCTTHLWSLKKTHLWNELELLHPSILFVLKLLNLSKMLHKQRFVVLQCMQMQAALRQTSLKQVTRNLLQQSPVTFSSQSVAFSWCYPIPQSNFKSPCH